ncbi:uncharacterized protein LOC106073776 [Biomphalaria glabrata]|uniref:Uncharacterized protein LOC106073776 n=1 Tax=Biomphalaria glabrata TaxID=6526 RepID=A0A9W2Z8I0_BIOGL|nr:uncharacterized protein LOC106073776 [Biomphalaria glabrata]XP_055871298.1 uncharacterized protein LOC106073776 [Biomphalaria glabrata]XP_055871299.1 uncharacterized protein LOC106073776 [Biomphalaria glabrata]XP_055871300.1 uncharacterized protein LOC106073776 [Biomphalaria glabrata]XP_055871301.1 uncharacterized protein LOC106073776 [Biomphalaria glabrata]XP_055871302.1 uncharacterized protein LOC106073776 [Biomphalaria glabrata]XP_055871303.1 uncharacterized protein LOC106073776 [Biomph
MQRVLRIILVVVVLAFAMFFLSSRNRSGSNIAMFSDPMSTRNQAERLEPKPYEVTIITLYVPLGKFQKGGGGNFYTNDKYRGWMQTFGWLSNKLVAFLTDDDTYNYFKQIRSHLPPERTVLIRVNRSELSSFKDYDRVNQIYSKPDYPKHHPNTVNANYSLTMNAKYEVLQMAMDLGHVNTTYIAWLDIGCLRNMLEEKIRPKNNIFTLEVPLDFEDGKVAFTEVGGRDGLRNLSPWEYIQQNQVWVAGSYFIAKKTVMLKFIRSYQKAVQVLLKDNMASTDQQVIGSMYSPQMIKDQEVEIKTYRCSNGQYGLYSSDIQYFCLAYVCKEAAELRRANKTLQLA